MVQGSSPEPLLKNGELGLVVLMKGSELLFQKVGVVKPKVHVHYSSDCLLHAARGLSLEEILKDGNVKPWEHM